MVLQDDSGGDGSSFSSSVVPGLYVSGWLKRGPTGIIGSNIADAKETTAAILEDLKSSGDATDRGEDPTLSPDLLPIFRQSGS